MASGVREKGRRTLVHLSLSTPFDVMVSTAQIILHDDRFHMDKKLKPSSQTRTCTKTVRDGELEANCLDH